MALPLAPMALLLAVWLVCAHGKLLLIDAVGGDCANSTCGDPCYCASFGAAEEATALGDTLRVVANLRLASLSDRLHMSGTAVLNMPALIEGDLASPPYRVISSDISNDVLTFSSGGTYEGHIDLTVRRLRFENCTSRLLYVYGLRITLTVASIEAYNVNKGGTTSTAGGAIYFMDFNQTHAELVLRDSTFTKVSVAGAGGALYAWGVHDVLIERVQFVQCTARGAGGSAAFTYIAGNLTLRDMDIKESHGATEISIGAGAFYLHSVRTLSLYNTTFDEIDVGGAHRGLDLYIYTTRYDTEAYFYNTRHVSEANHTLATSLIYVGGTYSVTLSLHDGSAFCASDSSLDALLVDSNSVVLDLNDNTRFGTATGTVDVVGTCGESCYEACTTKVFVVDGVGGDCDSEQCGLPCRCASLADITNVGGGNVCELGDRIRIVADLAVGGAVLSFFDDLHKLPSLIEGNLKSRPFRVLHSATTDTFLFATSGVPADGIALRIQYLRFENCTTTPIKILFLNNAVTLNYVDFYHTISVGQGGAVYHTGAGAPQAELSILNCKMTETTASTDAGALYATNISSLYIYDTHFTRCTATGSGGAVGIWFTPNITTRAVFYIENEAGVGGAIFAFSSGTFYNSKTYFVRNSAGTFGLDVFIYTSVPTLFTLDNSKHLNTTGGTLANDTRALIHADQLDTPAVLVTIRLTAAATLCPTSDFISSISSSNNFKVDVYLDAETKLGRVASQHVNYTLGACGAMCYNNCIAPTAAPSMSPTHSPTPSPHTLTNITSPAAANVSPSEEDGGGGSGGGGGGGGGESGNGNMLGGGEANNDPAVALWLGVVVVAVIISLSVFIAAIVFYTRKRRRRRGALGNKQQRSKGDGEGGSGGASSPPSSPRRRSRSHSQKVRARKSNPLTPKYDGVDSGSSAGSFSTFYAKMPALSSVNGPDYGVLRVGPFSCDGNTTASSAAAAAPPVAAGGDDYIELQKSSMYAVLRNYEDLSGAKGGTAAATAAAAAAERDFDAMDEDDMQSAGTVPEYSTLTLAGAGGGGGGDGGGGGGGGGGDGVYEEMPNVRGKRRKSRKYERHWLRAAAAAAALDAAAVESRYAVLQTREEREASGSGGSFGGSGDTLEPLVHAYVEFSGGDGGSTIDSK